MGLRLAPVGEISTGRNRVAARKQAGLFGSLDLRHGFVRRKLGHTRARAFSLGSDGWLGQGAEGILVSFGEFHWQLI
jgi:hypothetical protein